MSKKIVIAAVVGIALIGVVAAGARYYFWNRDKNGAPKTYQQQVADTTGKIEVIGDNLTIIYQECKKYPG